MQMSDGDAKPSEARLEKTNQRIAELKEALRPPARPKPEGAMTKKRKSKEQV